MQRERDTDGFSSERPAIVSCEQDIGIRWEGKYESALCGSYDDVPFRVDRIKCLGNAVVPQVAEVIAQAIKELVIKD